MRIINKFVKTNENGFTLTELMVTLAIFALLATAAVPSFQVVIKNNTITAEVNGLLAALQLARSEAAKRGMRVVICRSGDSTAQHPTCGGNANTWEKGWVMFALPDVAGRATPYSYDSAKDTLVAVGNPSRSSVIYHIQDSNLVLTYLDGGKTMVSEIIATGIDEFHIEFGIDTNEDHVPDYFSSSPTDTDLNQAVSARAHVLARGSREIQGYVNKKEYSFGNAATGPYNDAYYRRVFSASTRLRNLIASNLHLHAG